MDNLIEAHCQLSANHVAEITDMILPVNKKQVETSPEFRHLKQIQETEEAIQLEQHTRQKEDKDEAISCSQSLPQDMPQLDNHLVSPFEKVHQELIRKLRDDEIILHEGHRTAELAEPIKEISQSWLESASSPLKDKVTDLRTCGKDSLEYVAEEEKVSNDFPTVSVDKTNRTSDSHGMVFAPLPEVDTIRMLESDDATEQVYAMTQSSDSAETSKANFVSSEELLDESELVHNQPNLEAKQGPKNTVMLDFPDPKFPANCEDEFPMFCRENQSTLEQEIPVAEGDLVIPKESSSLHDYQEIRNTTLNVPIETTFPLDPQPIDLTEDPVKTQFENLETFDANINEKSEYREALLQDVDKNLFHTEESKGTNQKPEKLLQNEFQEAHMDRTPTSTPIQAKEAHIDCSGSSSKQNSEEQECEAVSSLPAVTLPVETRPVLQV